MCAPCRYQKLNITTPDDRETVQELEKSVMKRKAQLYEIEQSLPQKNSLYLQVYMMVDGGESKSKAPYFNI